MTYIDGIVLNLTERSCRAFQRLTGKTNVWLAVQLTNLSIIVYFVWAGLYFWTSDVAPRIFIGVFCGGLLYVLTQTIFKVPIEVYENDAYRRVANGLRNPRRVRDALLRLSFLTLALMLGYPVFFVYVHLRLHLLLLSYSLIVLTTVVLYLLACDPLPPCAGKLKEWFGRTVPSEVAQAKPAVVPDAQGRVRYSTRCPQPSRHACSAGGIENSSSSSPHCCSLAAVLMPRLASPMTSNQEPPGWDRPRELVSIFPTNRGRGRKGAPGSTRFESKKGSR